MNLILVFVAGLNFGCLLCAIAWTPLPAGRQERD